MSEARLLECLKYAQVILDFNVLPGWDTARLELAADRRKSREEGGGERWRGNLGETVGWLRVRTLELVRTCFKPWLCHSLIL